MSASTTSPATGGRALASGHAAAVAVAGHPRAITRLPLDLLLHDGPIARAYLGVLRAQGWRLRRIVRLLPRRDPVDGRTLAPWLPEAWRRRWAALVQDQRMNHWPRTLARREAAWVAPWLQALAGQYALDPLVLGRITGRAAGLDDDAEVVDSLLIDGWSDPALPAALDRLPSGALWLYSGGGIVPARVLSLPGRRLLHVHPGHLPQVRGADGLLWSVLVRGCPGATAFYMAPGLDTGDIVCAADLPVPVLPACWPGLEDTQRYRLLYAFVDPVLRAVLLRRVLAHALTTDGRPLHRLPAQAQRADQGLTYRFMHPALRRAAFERLWQLQGQVRPLESA